MSKNKKWSKQQSKLGHLEMTFGAEQTREERWEPVDGVSSNNNNKKQTIKLEQRRGNKNHQK
jgi:hypothetical protein